MQQTWPVARKQLSDQSVYYVTSYLLQCTIMYDHTQWIVFIEMYLDYIFNKCIKCITFSSCFE